MTRPDRDRPIGLVPLLLLSAVVVLVTFGFGRGFWLSNLHNGLLALAFALVGAYVLFQRPGHREGVLFMATGLVEAVMFFGRQVGHSALPGTGRWWGWLGVWPLVVSLALTTLSVMSFPDGHLPSRRWRPVAGVVVIIAVVCASLSALWPVEYGSAGMITDHPINLQAPAVVVTVWSAIAHPAYIGFQVLWVVAVVVRGRTARGHVRRQLIWLLSAAALSVLALLIGLAAWGSPRPGILSAALIPVAAGWAIVHGQHLAAYSAPSWLSRSAASPPDLPGDVARATAQALVASGATLWMGKPTALHAVGVWPVTTDEVRHTDLAALLDSPTHQLRTTTRSGEVTGALTIDRARADPLSRPEQHLFDDLTAQAALVIEHLDLAEVIAGERRAGHLDGMRPREQQVLELMARGLSNAAICEELHLSIKTVEPIVSAIFTKLELSADAASNRRVLAVLAYLRS